MIIYFEFENRKVNAEVKWPNRDEPIIVNLTDARMVKEFPADLYFEVEVRNKVGFIIEDKDDARLTELQKVIGRRLQEFVNKY